MFYPNALLYAGRQASRPLREAQAWRLPAVQPLAPLRFEAGMPRPR
jgi:hypothetical protein